MDFSDRDLVDCDPATAAGFAGAIVELVGAVVAASGGSRREGVLRAVDRLAELSVLAQSAGRPDVAAVYEAVAAESLDLV
jgi:hypothetical protein